MKFKILMIAAFSLAISANTIASDMATLEDLDLSTESIQYEMHLGALDVTCYGSDSDDNRFDTEAKVIDATITFSDADPSLHSNFDKVIFMYIKTGMDWFGVLDRDTLEIAIQSQRSLDVTDDNLKKYGGNVFMLNVENIRGKYVRGTIHGTLEKHIHYASLLQDMIRCKGETTFLLLPKNN